MITDHQGLLDAIYADQKQENRYFRIFLWMGFGGFSGFMVTVMLFNFHLDNIVGEMRMMREPIQRIAPDISEMKDIMKTMNSTLGNLDTGLRTVNNQMFNMNGHMGVMRQDMHQSTGPMRMFSQFMPF